jgi:hypothetical protein
MHARQEAPGTVSQAPARCRRRSRPNAPSLSHQAAISSTASRRPILCASFFLALPAMARHRSLSREDHPHLNGVSFATIQPVETCFVSNVTGSLRCTETRQTWARLGGRTTP